MQEKEIKYLSHRRYKGKTMIGKEVNLPAMQEIILKDNVLYWNNRPIAFDTSEVAHQYFAINQDGQGKRRGDYITIKKNGKDSGKILCVQNIKEWSIKTFGSGTIYFSMRL